jgi:hypothetical protein
VEPLEPSLPPLVFPLAPVLEFPLVLSPLVEPEV